MQKINFKIVTPEKVLFEQEVEQVTLPATDGQITIMPNHRSYITSLKAGEIVFKANGVETSLATSGGFLEFDENKLVLLADTAEVASEIDLVRAQQAMQRATALKQEKVSLDDLEYAKIAALIEKEMTRVHVAKKHHSKQRIIDNIQ